jgi:hypothetical protein
MFEMLPLLEAPKLTFVSFLVLFYETLDILNSVFLNVVKIELNFCILQTATLELLLCHLSIEYDVANVFFADISTSCIIPGNSLLYSFT